MRHKTKIRIFELVKDLEKETGHRLQYKDISQSTGLDRRTVSALMKGVDSQVSLSTIDSVLDFFAAAGHPVDVADLFVVERQPANSRSRACGGTRSSKPR